MIPKGIEHLLILLKNSTLSNYVHKFYLYNINALMQTHNY